MPGEPRDSTMDEGEVLGTVFIGKRKMEEAMSLMLRLATWIPMLLIIDSISAFALPDQIYGMWNNDATGDNIEVKTSGDFNRSDVGQGRASDGDGRDGSNLMLSGPGFTCWYYVTFTGPDSNRMNLQLRSSTNSRQCIAGVWNRQTSGSSHTPSEQNRQQALEAITSTADRICDVVHQEGKVQSTKVSGEVDAGLQGLMRKLVNLNLRSEGDLNTTQYQGVLQKDLPLALKDNTECKKHIFDRLVELMLK